MHNAILESCSIIKDLYSAIPYMAVYLYNTEADTLLINLNPSSTTRHIHISSSFPLYISLFTHYTCLFHTSYPHIWLPTGPLSACYQGTCGWVQPPKGGSFLLRLNRCLNFLNCVLSVCLAVYLSLTVYLYLNPFPLSLYPSCRSPFGGLSSSCGPLQFTLPFWHSGRGCCLHITFPSWLPPPCRQTRCYQRSNLTTWLVIWVDMQS